MRQNRPQVFPARDLDGRKPSFSYRQSFALASSEVGTLAQGHPSSPFELLCTSTTSISTRKDDTNRSVSICGIIESRLWRSRSESSLSPAQRTFGLPAYAAPGHGRPLRRSCIAALIVPSKVRFGPFVSLTIAEIQLMLQSIGGRHRAHCD